MSKFLGTLCLVLYPAVAGATNFDACVTDAKTSHNETAGTGYSSYKCEGTTAEKLSARPDECGGGQKPPLSSLVRKKQQFDDGLWSQLSWRAGKCSGSCEMRSYDSKDTHYQCEVKIYTNGAAPPTDVIREPAPREGGEGPGTDTGPDTGPDTAATPRPGRSHEVRLRSRRRLERPERWPPPERWEPPPPRQYTYDRPILREPMVRDRPPQPVPYRYDGRFEDGKYYVWRVPLQGPPPRAPLPLQGPPPAPWCECRQ
jgi:hypothetical protein